MSSTSAAASATATSTSTEPTQYKAIGVCLAIGSGILIGSSFVFKKKGLLAAEAKLSPDHVKGEGVAYLKNPLWWTGMTMMICGELLNFGAYAFVEAIIVTPLGALSVVICAILSSIFLQEKLSLFGWIGCFQCIVGAVIIALNGPQEQSVSTILAFKALFLAPWFLAFGSVVIAVALSIIFYFGPKYGSKSMLWYIAVCSLIGGLSVSCTQGLGASIVTSIRGDNQFDHWFIYFLLAFVAVTLVTEVIFLNKALALYNTAMVTPTYYVIFTTCTLVTSVILYEGLKASASQILTVVLGFFVICSGITLLQLSKVDPNKLSMVDPKSSILLKAAREEVAPTGGDGEKAEVAATEEPGMDALRGTFGAVGSIIRLRRRASTLQSGGSDVRSRRGTMSTDIEKGPTELRQHATSPNGAGLRSDSTSEHEAEPSMNTLLALQNEPLVTSPLSEKTGSVKKPKSSPSVKFAESAERLNVEEHELDDNGEYRGGHDTIRGLPGTSSPSYFPRVSFERVSFERGYSHHSIRSRSPTHPPAARLPD